LQFWKGADMQTSEIVSQAKPAARPPEKFETRANRPDGGASRPGNVKQPAVVVGSKRKPRRYGAGF
jgi:hypothetical protein